MLEDVAVLNCLLNFAFLLQGSLTGRGREKGGGEEVGSGDEALECKSARSADDAVELVHQYLFCWPMKHRE